MKSQQAGWGKALLVTVLLVYLLALLSFVLLAPYTHIEPGPTIEAGTSPALVTDPPDFSAITDVSQRKQAFFNFMRPLIAYQNAFYHQERERLQAIVAKLEAGQCLSRSDRRKLAYWSRELHLKPELSTAEQVEYLQRRLHPIPEAMVLAQAAIESAWGRSRFARQANNYFGQWCYTPGCGLIPLRRSAKATHEVRKFDSAREAIRSYFRNINSHRAYRPLRDKRLMLEQAGKKVTGHTLVGELDKYSQRGQDYVKELRVIIRGNGLE